MKRIRYCPNCKEYMLKEICSCGNKSISRHPPRYSPDKMAEYRRKSKKQILKEKGLL